MKVSSSGNESSSNASAAIAPTQSSYCSYDEVKTTKLWISNIYGNETIDKPTVSSTILFQATISDHCTTAINYPFTLILEVMDSNYNVKLISLLGTTVNPNEEFTAFTAWIPENAGNYTIKAFSLHCLPCTGLPPITSSQFTVVNVDDYSQQQQQQQQNIEGAYSGIEREDDTTVTINNHPYYMTTLSTMAGISQIPKGATFTFRNVTFTFPYGSLNTPGGPGTVFEVKYPDGTIEKFGKVAENYGEVALFVPSSPHAKVPIAETVLGAHQNPNAGVAIYNKGEQIKLLVSK